MRPCIVFFQAEDGIRDVAVTGVQTCALPISRPFRRKGLGMIMIRELYFLAAARNIATVVPKMMRPQKGAQTIFHRLGFREEALLPDYVRDLTGKPQDLLIMICKLGDMWTELDQFYSDSDWER